MRRQARAVGGAAGRKCSIALWGAAVPADRGTELALHPPCQPHSPHLPSMTLAATHTHPQSPPPSAAAGRHPWGPGSARQRGGRHQHIQTYTLGSCEGQSCMPQGAVPKQAGSCKASCRMLAPAPHPPLTSAWIVSSLAPCCRAACSRCISRGAGRHRGFAFSTVLA